MSADAASATAPASARGGPGAVRDIKRARSVAPGRSSFVARAAAVALAAFLVAGALASLTAPLRAALAERAAAEARLARYQALLARAETGALARYDLAEIVGADTDDAAAQLALQGVLNRAARRSGFSVSALRATGAEAMEGVGRAVWVEVTLAGDLEALKALLDALDAERPILLVRALEIEAGGGARPDRALTVRLEAGRVWRAEGEGA